MEENKLKGSPLDQERQPEEVQSRSGYNDYNEKNHETILPIVKLNKKYLIVPKMLYFTLFLAYYSCYIFKLKFFKDVLSIPEEDAAFIYSATFVVTAIGSVFWNYVADYTCRPKLVVQITALGMGGFFQLFALMPNVPEDMRFGLEVAVILLWTFCYSSLQPLLDAIVVNQLKLGGYGREVYGRQRMWGTVGYGIVTMVVGRAIDGRHAKTRDEVTESYQPMFYIVAGTTLMFMLCFQLLVVNDDPFAERRRRVLERQMESEKKPLPSSSTTTTPHVDNRDGDLSKWVQVKKLLCNVQFIFLCLITLFVGYGRQNMYTFRSLYVEEYILGDDDNKKLWIGITTISGLFFEFVILFYGKSLLQRVGNYWLLTFALVAMTARLWAYVIVPEGDKVWIWFIIVVEFCRGVSLAALQVAGVQLCAVAAGPDLQSTAQGIFTSINNGVAGVFGTIGSGVILKQTHSFKLTFMSCSILSSVALLGVLVWPIIQKKRR